MGKPQEFEEQTNEQYYRKAAMFTCSDIRHGSFMPYSFPAEMATSLAAIPGIK